MTTMRDRHALVSGALRIDGIFEIALGLLLATAPWSGLLSAMRLPPPAGTGPVVAVGLALIPVGVWLLVLARRWSAPIVRVIAIANAAGALLFASWLAFGWGHFASPGRLVVGVTTLALALFATFEWSGGGARDVDRAAPPRVASSDRR
jgi:hypothetical protein